MSGRAADKSPCTLLRDPTASRTTLVGTNDLQDEWARANRGGRAANRQKAIATGASIAVTLAIVAAGYVLLFAVWFFDKMPVFILALPWLPALPAGWWIRKRLWPRGAYAR